MTFNSYRYFVALILLVLVYQLLRKRTVAQNWLLLIASYCFYACWDWRFLSLVFISTWTDFFVAQKVYTAKSQSASRRWLAVSLLVNLGLLGFFKYFNFFVASAQVLLNSIGWEADFPTLHIILPVGISFYTFQTLSYTIDVYRRKTQPTTNLLNFSLYVTFFPQLVAGPIERPSHLLPQIENPRVVRWDDIAIGLHHIVMGLFKKVVIADNMAAIVDGAFAKGAEPLNGLENWLALTAFAMQIYGDFSGYSSIAQGSARVLGIDVSYNFHVPYFAKTPSEFWTRWHVTLSQWLRDYVYVPLGGNRFGPWLTYRNLMLTMLIGGLWHGAGWNFVLWGFYHGLILCVYRWLAIQDRGGPGIRGALYGFLMTVLMFVLTLIGWMFFRLDNVQQIGSVGASLLSIHKWAPTATSAYIISMILFLTAPLMAYEYVIYRTDNDHLWLFRQYWMFRLFLYEYCVIMMILYSVESPHEFIYFQF